MHYAVPSAHAWLLGAELRPEGVNCEALWKAGSTRAELGEPVVHLSAELAQGLRGEGDTHGCCI
jgi:hypothetical protein